MEQQDHDLLIELDKKMSVLCSSLSLFREEQNKHNELLREDIKVLHTHDEKKDEDCSVCKDNLLEKISCKLNKTTFYVSVVLLTGMFGSCIGFIVRKVFY